MGAQINMRPKWIKQCPNCSKVVPDTEYVSNLGTKNMKIKTLIHTFCIPPPAIQQ